MPVSADSSIALITFKVATPSSPVQDVYKRQLIGSPVEHSLSPAMHTQSFNELGVDCVYLAYDIEPQDLESAAVGMKKMGFAGYNVTMPHKTFIPKYLDELSDAAELMGAVNTVAIKQGKAIGHNTDGAGFMRNLKENGVDVIGKKITIVGAGGAGSALSLIHICQIARPLTHPLHTLTHYFASEK